MRLREPAQAPALADLLVGHGQEHELARGRETLALERREGDGGRRHLSLHVERAASPDLVVHEIAGPRVSLPLRRVREHRVRVREERQRRPVAAAKTRDDVRPLRLARVELDLDPVPREVVAEHLGGADLVPRRVDRLRADQRLQERRDLIAERSARGQVILTPLPLRRRFCLRQRRQLVADLPELGIGRLRHEPAEQLDRRPLRPDDAVADDPRDDLVVAHAPQLGLLVELHERLRELVELLVLAPLDVELREREARLAASGVEGLAESREDPAQLGPPRRVEAGAVPEHLPDLLVLPGRHVLEHLELRDQEANAEDRAPEKTKGAPQVALLDQADRLVGVVPRELQPQLGRLVRHLEEQLVAVDPLLGGLLESEELLGREVALVVRAGVSWQDRTGVILGLGAASRHALSILRAWPTSSARRRASARRRTPRSRCVCGRSRSTSWSASSTCSARARPCASRSRRTGRPR